MSKKEFELYRWEQLVKTAIITKSPLLLYYKKMMRECLYNICSIKYPNNKLIK